MAHCSGVSPSAMGKEGTRSPSNSFLSDRTRTIRFPLSTTAPTSRSYSSRRDLFSSSSLEPAASADVDSGSSWSGWTSILGPSSATSADFYVEICFIQVAISVPKRQNPVRLIFGKNELGAFWESLRPPLSIACPNVAIANL